MKNAKFIIQVSKGLIRDLRARRLLMFYVTLAALILLFAGSTLLWPLLRAHPLLFIAFWAVCAWLTVLVALLALYDLLRVRGEASRARRALEQNIGPLPEDEDPR